MNGTVPADRRALNCRDRRRLRRLSAPSPSTSTNVSPAKSLTGNEQQRLDDSLRAAYARHRLTATLTADAIDANTAWTAAGGRQSLLSMYPHEELIPLVTAAGIGRHLTRVDGRVGPDRARRHRQEQGLAPDRVVVVGDSLDDARAARECATRCTP